MRNENCIIVHGVENGIDFDAHYSITGYSGIAFYLLGWSVTFEETTCFQIDDETGEEFECGTGEFETIPDYSYVVAVMVGDDRHHKIDVSDLTVLGEDKFCRTCGQIGCQCNVYV